MVLGIDKITAREVLDSRGNPTVEATVSDGKLHASAIVPSGASTGIHEALELRDKDPKRFGGKGVLKAIENVKAIEKKLQGMDYTDQEKIDSTMIELDGTENKSKLGANAMLAVSLASARLAALKQETPLHEYIQSIAKTKPSLPTPFFNVINGGKHADNALDFQEFMIATKAKSFRERLQIGTEVYHQLKKIIGKKYGKDSTNVGDEGGFAPNVANPREPLELLTAAVEELGYQKQVEFAMDVAASDFYDAKKKAYILEGKETPAEKLEELYHDLIKSYPMMSIEDPFNEDNFDEFASLTKNANIQVVGDDLLVTNPKRIAMAVEQKACNALLLKVNQIGTLSESIQAAKAATDAGWKVMVSHRSGETEDTFIADLVVGLGTGQIKTGAPCRGERTAKYNQLLRIEEVTQ